jgi:hypothetical protein
MVERYLTWFKLFWFRDDAAWPGLPNNLGSWR